MKSKINQIYNLKNGKNTVFIILLAVFISSCTIKPVELKNIGEVSVLGIQDNSVVVKVSATIDNPNPRLKIKSSDLVLSVGNSQIGNITLLDNIVLKGKSSGYYSTRIKFVLSGHSLNLLSLSKIFNKPKKDFKISGTIKITAPLYYKKIKLSDYQLVN